MCRVDEAVGKKSRAISIGKVRGSCAQSRSCREGVVEECRMEYAYRTAKQLELIFTLPHSGRESLTYSANAPGPS